MPRYRGRVIVKKVGEDGTRIPGKLAVWRKKNPTALVFDSMPEYEVWKFFKDEGINAVNQPTLLLHDVIKTTEFKKGEIKPTSQRKIEYTPDYYLPDYDLYIEVKGYADDLFKLRWKLFKLKGYNGYIVYSLAECKALMKILKSDEK